MPYKKSPIRHALNLLAKRFHPELEEDDMWFFLLEYPYTQCRICNETIFDGDRLKHGMQHLQEHNLAAFL